MDKDNTPQEEEGPPAAAPPIPEENPSSPAGSSSSSSAVDEIVLWSNSDSSSSDNEFSEKAKSLLDFKSPTFNPALALKCDQSEMLHLSKGARQYLNLQHYSKATNSPSKTPRKDIKPVKIGGQPFIKQPFKNVDEAKKEEPTPSSSSTCLPSATTSSSNPLPANFPIPGRRFLPHQLPVYRPRREHPNVITLMSTVDGPLSVLNRVMREKTRIKIWTRNDKGFRGFLTGFVEAFDKHWNIALRDVDEQFVRKKVIKFPIFGDNISEGNSSRKTISANKGNNNNDDNEDREKEQAISSAFIRLKNYLRQNDGMTRRKRIESSNVSQASIQKTNKNKSSSISSKNTITGTTSSTKSKTVYVGDMDPLSICRTGLANLSLGDDIHHDQPPSKKQASSISSRSSPPPPTRRKSTRLMTRPDIIHCHQTRSITTTTECSSSSSTSVATTSSTSTCSTQHQQHPPPPPNIISRTSLKKKSLTVFKTPYEDSFGFMVVAQTRKYELVERHVGQVLLMGNDIVFIETSCSASSSGY